MFDDARWGEDPRDRVDDHDKDLDHDCREPGRGPGDDSRETLAERERDCRSRGADSRDVFTRHLNLPHGLQREVVRDRDREYTLRSSETRTLASVGAFRVVSSRDLRDQHDRPLHLRSGDLRHLREQGLVEAVRVPGTREYAVALTKDGRKLLERHRDRHQGDRQTFWDGLKRERELGHDLQVYLRHAVDIVECTAHVHRAARDRARVPRGVRPRSARLAARMNSEPLYTDAVRIWLDVPDAVVAQLTEKGRDLSRAVLEALAIDAYRTNRLTAYQLCDLLEISTRYELDGFLKQHGVPLEYSLDDFEREGATSTRVLEKRQAELAADQDRQDT